MSVKTIYFKIFFVALLIVSCESDDEGVGFPVIPDQGQETAQLSFESEDPFYGPGETVSYTVTLPSTSTSTRQVTVENIIGASIFRSLAIVNSGATTAEGTIAIPDINPGTIAFDETGSFTASVVGARQGALEGEGEDEVFVPSGGDAVATTSEPGSISIFDRSPLADEDGLNILFDWANPDVNDLDLEVIDAGFTAFFLRSLTGSRYEGGVFENSSPDGDYDVYITIFDEDNATLGTAVSGRLFFTDSEGNKTLLEFEIPAGTATNARFAVVRFTQETVDGVPTYTNIVLL